MTRLNPGLNGLLLLSSLLIPTRGTAQVPSGLIGISAARSRLAISLPAARNAADESRRISEVVASCRRVMEISPADSAIWSSSAISSTASEEFDRAGLVEFTLTPVPTLGAECGATRGAPGLLEARGLWVAYDSVHPASRQLGRVTLRRGGVALTQANVTRSALLQLSPRGLLTTPSGVVRVQLALEALFADSIDERSDLTVEVVVNSDGVVDLYTVPWPILRELWDQGVALRARAVASQQPALRLPPPADANLLGAHRAFESGDASVAATIAAQELLRNRLDESDRRYARALNTLIFAEAGDAVAARINAEYLLEADPCFSWDAEAPASVRGLMDRLRDPSARCAGMPLSMVLLRSAIIPGFARPREIAEERRSRLGVFFVIAASIGGGAVAGSDAKKQYRTYLAAIEIPGADDFLQPRPNILYQKAEQKRVFGERLVIAGAAAWVASTALAVWQERRYTNRLALIHSYGEPMTPQRVGLRIQPRIQPRDRGFAAMVEISW